MATHGKERHNDDANPKKIHERRQRILSTSSLPVYDDDEDATLVVNDEDSADIRETEPNGYAAEYDDEEEYENEPAQATNTSIETTAQTRPARIDKEAARRKAAAVKEIADLEDDDFSDEQDYWCPEIDGGKFYADLTPAEKAMREMVIKIRADADDDERLQDCCSLVVSRMDGSSVMTTGAEAIFQYEQLHPFTAQLAPQKVVECLHRAQKRFEATRAANRIGMLSPSQLIAIVRNQPNSELIPNFLSAAELGTLSGPKNGLKTLFALDAIVSLAIGPGAKLLEYFPINRAINAGLLAAEDPKRIVLDALERICRAKQIDMRNLDGRLFVNNRPSWRFNSRSIALLRNFILSNDLKFCVVEAGYMSLGGADQRSLMAMGEALAPIRRLVDETGCAIQLSVHHKGSASSSHFPTLSDISGVGHEEAARSWAILNKRRPWNPTTGQHWLRLVLGNKAGEHRFHLDVREGNANDPEGRVWEPVITPIAATDNEPPSKTQKRGQGPQPSEGLTENEVKMLGAIDKNPEGLHMTNLGRTSKVSYRQWEPTISSLQAKGLIEKFAVTESKKKSVEKYRRPQI
jgi:hypothetical protein